MVSYRKIAVVLAAALLLPLALLASVSVFGDKATMDTVASGDFKVELSPPESGSPRARALAALDRAQDVTLYSLQPWQPPQSPPAWQDLPQAERSQRETEQWQRSEREWCKRERCYHHNRVLGQTSVKAADLQEVHKALRESLGQVPDYAAACIPEYRHAVSFISAGKHYDVLLCYGCGQVAVVIDDDLHDRGQTYAMGEERALDAILTRAGIALAAKPDH